MKRFSFRLQHLFVKIGYEQAKMVQKGGKVIRNRIFIDQLKIQTSHIKAIHDQVVAFHVAVHPACRHGLRSRNVRLGH